MKSIKSLYNIGRGPSSSHTMGPSKAAKITKARYSDANKYVVTLYNSLALTGYGHLTFKAIEEELKPHEVIFETKIDQKEHPNTALFQMYKDDVFLGEEKIKSVGGGKIIFESIEDKEEDVYTHSSFKSIKNYCARRKISLFQYVLMAEGECIIEFLYDVWKTMKKTVETGLKKSGFLPGSLKVRRKARKLYQTTEDFEMEDTQARLVSSFAFACAEENAAGGIVATAPTCGSCGVLPGVLYYTYVRLGFSEQRIIEAIGVASIFGNLIKHNASISGAEAGCQAEIGSACAMAAAAAAYLKGYSISKIEYSAEVALEHSLGLTCDPVRGYVQIPCIERNALYAMKAIDASRLAGIITSLSKVSFDTVVETMLETGKDLAREYRETAEGGLAKYYKEKKAK
ncbi:L-serine ammonia-lyase, iron-sulfur-dependent, subunit alpha [Acholeplasma sp. OttesenSCG-928-E16]|nr:L-serine ammonia-lyase, iron-sulfur-dependent, subunit alpha [Acholeplasma sp. OttesenSCG-928-E16]